jgi:hypothetical protein
MSVTTNPVKTGQDRGSEFIEKTKDTAASTMDKAKDAASSAYDKAKDAGANVAEKAKDMASGLVDKAKGAAGDIGKRAEDATHAVGSGMQSFAGTLRENLPKEGVLGSASGSVARSLEAGGKYLETEGLSGIAEDMTNLIRRNPIPALLVGIGLGFLLARATHMHRS